METMIAYCGLDCVKCPAYIATQADDRAALEKVAAEWRKAFDPHITADSIICDGCLVVDGGRIAGYCSVCEIRACARGRKLDTCAPCAEYESCAKLIGFHAHAPEAQATLARIRMVACAQ